MQYFPLPVDLDPFPARPAPPCEKGDSPSIPGILAPKGSKKTENKPNRAKNRLKRAKLRGFGPKNTSFCCQKSCEIGRYILHLRVVRAV